MADLKPCPFCGGEADIWIKSQNRHPFVGSYILVKCDVCGACTKTFYNLNDIPEDDSWTHWETAERAIKAWNRRVNEPKTKTIILCNINDAPCNDCEPVCDSRKEIKYD